MNVLPLKGELSLLTVSLYSSDSGKNNLKMTSKVKLTTIHAIVSNYIARLALIAMIFFCQLLKII